MRILSHMLPQRATYFSDGPIRNRRSWPSPRPRRAVLAILKTRNRLNLNIYSTAMSTTSLAHVGDFLGLGEGLEDFWLATDAYIYGYPLVTMEYTRRIMTNVAAPEGNR